jgi:Na+-driven multidrug efflux pump
VGVFNAVSLLLIYPSLGVAQAMQPLIAFNRGANRPDRVRALLWRALAATLTMGIVFSLVVGLFPGPVASLFTRSDESLVTLVRQGLPWFMVSVAVFGIQGTASHYFLSANRPGKAALLLLGRQLLAIPLFLVLPRLFGFRGLYLVAGLSDLPMAILAAILLRSEWNRLSIQPAPENDPLPESVLAEAA